MSLETQKTKAGTYLYEYAAANPKTVSIRDLYMTLSGVAEEVADFKNQESNSNIDSDDSNLWYCLEDQEGNVYTNVASWENGYTMAVAQKLSYPFAFGIDRTDGADKFRSLADRKTVRLWRLPEAICRAARLRTTIRKCLLHLIRIWKQVIISHNTVRFTASGCPK